MLSEQDGMLIDSKREGNVMVMVIVIGGKEDEGLFN
jgi:hypothetical protein